MRDDGVKRVWRSIHIVGSIVIALIILTGVVEAREQIVLATNRISVYSPYVWWGDANVSNTSFSFTTYALKLDKFGMAQPGVNITFRIYTPSMWDTMTSAPATVGAGGSLVYPGTGDFIYAFRGGGATEFWRYNITANTWDNRTSAPAAVREGGSLAATRDFIYAFRGDRTTTFWRYNITANSWETMAPAPATVSAGGSLAATRDFIYAFRGWHPFLGWTTDFWRYNITANSWEIMAPAPAAVREGGSLVYPGTGDFIYAFGGGGTTAFWRYNITADRWDTMRTAPATVSAGGSLAATRDFIYAFRGGGNLDFWRYSLNPDITRLWNESTRTTDANGTASLINNTRGAFTIGAVGGPYDADYGLWRIRAVQVGTPTINATTFINISAPQEIRAGVTVLTCGYTHCHEPARTDRFRGTPLSPYSTVRVGVGTSFAGYMHGDVRHRWTGAEVHDCAYCHGGYGRLGAGANPTARNWNTTPFGAHSRISCINSSCHDVSTRWGVNFIPRMPSCYGAGCHPVHNRRLTTFNTRITGSTYSDTWPTPTGRPMSAHSPRPVLCIICHGPMHNITTPHLAGRRNNFTEDAHCLTCHSSPGFERHNGTVNCTTCHSHDIHDIKYLQPNGTFLSARVPGANRTAVNCISCHANNSAIDAALARHGSPPAPKVPTSTNFNFNHSQNPLAGELWNGTHWNRTSDLSACIYCHSDTTHRVNALGPSISILLLNNTLNTTISNRSYWCAGCHWQGAANYSRMVSSFTDRGMRVPIEITGGLHSNGSAAAADGTRYVNHSAWAFHDESCKACHGGLLSGHATTTEFAHNVAIGTLGGPDCVACHIGQFERHNGTVNCTTCHSHDIHDIKYLQPNGTFLSARVPGANRTAANCTSCHAGNSAIDAVLARHGSPPAPKVPTSTNFNFNHSQNPLAGELWNGTHWNRTSDLSACIYCHGDTRHRVNALGPSISILLLNNTRNATISNRSYWCAGCHWQGAANYSRMVSSFTDRGMRVPIEITGGLHSNGSAAAADGTRYVNHSAWAFHDESCKSCHGGLLSGRATTTEFAHNVAIGIFGGPDCVACHDLGKSAIGQVDVSVIMTSVHANLNKEARATVDSRNKNCWACHGDGTQPTGGAHPARYKNPLTCEECHVGTPRFNAPPVFEHYAGADDVKAHMRCSACHRNSHNVHLNPYIVIPAGELEGRVAHYAGRLLHTGCRECHQDANVSARYGRATLVYAHDKLACEVCHAVPGTTIRSLHDRNMWIPRLTCAECHTIEHWVLQYQVPEQIISHYPRASPGAGNTLFTGYDCDDCHGNAPIHSINLTTTRWGCADCHTPNGTGKIARYTPLIEPYSHGDATCEGCHAVDQRFHFTPYALGDVALPGWANWTPGRITDCVDCHVDHAGETFNTPDAASMQTSHTSLTINCTICHGTDLISMHDDGSVEGCGWCHSNPTVHYVQSPNDTDCFACHVEFVPEPQTAHGVELADRYTCIQCHEYHLFAVRARAHTPYGWFMSSGSPYLPADEIHIAHDGVNFWAFFPTCAPCHGNLLDEMNDCDWCHAIAERPVPIKPPVLEPPVVEPEPEPKPWYVIPGFGAISAIVLLLAAAFLAMRRR